MSKGNFKLINRLYNQGFDLTPTAAPGQGEKQRAIVEGWSKLTGHKRLPLEVVTAKEGYGVITGHQIGEGKQFLIGIDVDSNIPSLSTKVKEHLLKDLGQFPLRVGQSPKFLVPVICDEILSKLQSKKYRDQDGNTAKIEILARGQYFNCEGPHPKGVEGQYAWHLGPMDLKQLPRMNTAMIKDLLRWFDQLCERNNYQEVGGTGQAQRSNVVNFAGGDDFMAEVEKPPLDIEVDEIKRQLSRLAASELDHDEWIAVGMGLFHQFGGSAEGFKLWASWSAQDKTMCRENPKRPRFDLALCRRKWQSFGGRKGQALTWASVIYRHGLNDSGGSAVDNHDEVAPAEVAVTVDPWVTCDVYSDHIPTPQWLISKRIEKDTFIVIYGDRAAAKTYFALKLNFAVGTGAGYEVPEKRVVAYMCGEGSRGLRSRIRALRQYHSVEGEDLKNILVSTSILDFSDEKSVKRCVDSLRPHKPSMVTIDTLARASGNLDENNTKDANIIVNACDYIRRELGGCCVVLITHTSKGNQQSARGSTVLEGAADLVLRAERVKDENERYVVKVTPTKIKDGDEWGPDLFNFERVDFEQLDIDGEPLHSSVLLPCDDSTVVAKAKKPKTENQLLLISTVNTLMDVGDVVKVPAQICREHGWDVGAEGVDYDQALERFAESKAAELNYRLRETFKRTCTKLINDGYLALYQNVLVLIRRI